MSHNAIGDQELPAVSAAEEAQYLRDHNGHIPNENYFDPKEDALTEETPEDDAEIDALLAEIEDTGYEVADEDWDDMDEEE